LQNAYACNGEILDRIFIQILQHFLVKLNKCIEYIIPFMCINIDVWFSTQNQNAWMLNSFSPSLFRINCYLDIYWEVFIHEYFFIRGYLTSVMRTTFSTLNPFYFVGIFIFFSRSLYFSIPLSSLMLGPAVYLAVGQTKIKT